MENLNSLCDSPLPLSPSNMLKQLTCRRETRETWPVLEPKAAGPGRLKLDGTPEKPTDAPEAAAAGAGAAAFFGAGAAADATDGVWGLGCQANN